MPIKDVTSVSLIFRDQGYISATDYKIFYNDTMPNIISTSEVKTKSKLSGFTKFFWKP